MPPSVQIFVRELAERDYTTNDFCILLGLIGYNRFIND